jgi:uncharacterized protein YacL
LNIERLLRIVGGILLGIGGWYLGAENQIFPPTVQPWLRAEYVGAAVGAILGLFIAPYLSTRPARIIVEQARRWHIKDLVAALFGLIIALVLSTLMAIPLSDLPGILGRLLPFAVCLFLIYVVVTIVVSRREDIFSLLGWFQAPDRDVVERSPGVLLDTSAIIDGRIADVGRLGFLATPVVVPRFVLRELQRIADSPDALRRGRGRRGLELLERLQKNGTVPIRIHDGDAEGENVDAKLVQLAQKLRFAIVTTDFNLNRVAAVQGVRVLNVNELANAVKTAVLPGEEMSVHVIQEGKEPGQGVAYLDDGTMVVVDGGRRYVDADVGVVVTRVFQTAAGRMIFAQARENHREAEPTR